MRELSGVHVNRGRLCMLCAEVSRRLHREGGRSLQVGKVTGRGSSSEIAAQYKRCKTFSNFLNFLPLLLFPSRMQPISHDFPFSCPLSLPAFCFRASIFLSFFDSTLVTANSRPVCLSVCLCLWLRGSSVPKLSFIFVIYILSNSLLCPTPTHLPALQPQVLLQPDCRKKKQPLFVMRARRRWGGGPSELQPGKS